MSFANSCLGFQTNAFYILEPWSTGEPAGGQSSVLQYIGCFVTKASSWFKSNYIALLQTSSHSWTDRCFEFACMLYHSIIFKICFQCFFLMWLLVFPLITRRRSIHFSGYYFPASGGVHLKCLWHIQEQAEIGHWQIGHSLAGSGMHFWKMHAVA